MAERNQRKIADPIDLNDDDPFAELTRIMGFDPRLAARESQPSEPGPLRPQAATAVAMRPSPPAPAVRAAGRTMISASISKRN